MNILNIHNIDLNPLLKNLHLHYKCFNTSYIRSQKMLQLSLSGFASFSGYFSLFFPFLYKKFVKRGTIFLEIEVKGEGSVQLNSLKSQYHLPIIISQHSVKSQKIQKIRILVCDLQANIQREDMYYLEFFASDGELLIKKISYVLETDFPVFDVHLGICICTFKKEKYVNQNLEILSENETIKNQFSVFISDNAGTLNVEKNYNFLHLQTNPNYGGSGGFAYSLMKALEDSKITHILFMDDDVEINSETIFRLIQFYKLIGKEKVCFAGGMIDLFKNEYMYETGAIYNPKKISYNPINWKSNLSCKEKIANMVKNADALEYGGFWFFSMPKISGIDYGLLLPFFIRADDLEYNYRLREKGFSILYQPGISIMHEPFYAKDPEWIQYYFWRNNLIFNCLRFKAYFFRFWKSILLALLKNTIHFRYKQIEFCLQGVEDYLKGPSFLQNIRPDELHFELLNLSKADPDRIINPFTTFEKSKTKVGFSKLKLLFTVLSLNGNLFRIFPQTKLSVTISVSRDRFEFLKTCGGAKEITVVNDAGKYSITYRLNQRRFWKIIFSIPPLFLKSLFLWFPVAQKWRKAEKELVSYEFWTEYWNKAK